MAPADNVQKLFYEVDMMKSEPFIHDLVGQNTSIPVPEIVFSDFSGEVVDTDYLIMEYLPGSPGSFSHSVLGKFVRELHDIHGQAYGYPERAAPVGDNWPVVFKRYVEMIFDDCLSCKVIDSEEYDWFLSVYDENFSVIEDVRASLLHLDLWWQNILTVDGEITAVLDFDRGLFGDVELEFAVLDTYGYSTPDFFEGYGRPRPCDERAQVRQKLYIVYELIKYAFIRTARGMSMNTGRGHVVQCKEILTGIA